MLKIKSDVLYVRNPDTKVFEPVAAIRGADGIVENLSAFSTSEIGDSTYLLMTQKGATDILNRLTGGLVTVGRAANADFSWEANKANEAETANHAVTASSAAEANYAHTAGEVNHAKEATWAESAKEAERAESASSAARVSVWHDYDWHDGNIPIAFADNDGYVYTSEALAYHPTSETLTVKKIAGKATEAETAQKLNSPPVFGAFNKQIFLTAGSQTSTNFTVPYAEEANSASKVSIGNDDSNKFARPIPFVDGITGELLQHSSGISYTPSTKTLKVGTVKGNLEGNVTGNVTGRADTASYAFTAFGLGLTASYYSNISGGIGDMPPYLVVGTAYLLWDGSNIGIYYHKSELGGSDVLLGTDYRLSFGHKDGASDVSIIYYDAKTGNRLSNVNSTLYFATLGTITIAGG